MPSFRIIALPPSIAAEVRRTHRSPQYGHPAHAEIATGYGPCRCCLRRFAEGHERRLLFTYNPHADGVPAPGPVYVHEDACVPWSGSGLPPELRDLPLLFEALDAAGLPVVRVPPDAAAPDAALDALLQRPGVDRVLLRNREAGCFIALATRT